jgi:GTP-binding protein YchF
MLGFAGIVTTAAWARPVAVRQTQARYRSRPASLASSRSLRCKLQTGIVGLPNVGKSTLFNALCEQTKAEAANFPFCTIEPNIGVVTVPDSRLEVLSEIGGSSRIVPTYLEFVDIAGLVKGASRGEGLGNRFLSHIRECDAIVHVVRCFMDERVVHVAGHVHPKQDIETIDTELMLADLAMVEKRLERLRKPGSSRRSAGAGTMTSSQLAEDTERSALERVTKALDAGMPIRRSLSDCTVDERQALRRLGLLTAKPVIYAANVADSVLAAATETLAKAKMQGNVWPDNESPLALVREVFEYAALEQAPVVAVSAQLESELVELPPLEREQYLESLGINDLQNIGLRALVRAAYETLGLCTFFTCGPQETRAWTIPRGTKAPQAAGVIHSDFERGFIRAETVSFVDLVKAGSLTSAREQGLVRAEGKDYVVQEGDVILFRFNV